MFPIYFDYRGPAIAAGAVQRSNGSWVLPNGAVESCALDALDCLQAKPVAVDPPKTRSFAAIRRSYSGAGTCRAPGMAVRAVQYAEWMKGCEAPHSANINYADRAVTFDRAEDGSKRARHVYHESERVEIPHWDWAPTVEDLSLCLFD